MLDCDATDGRNGGAWAILTNGKILWQGEGGRARGSGLGSGPGEDQEATSLVLDLPKALERVSPPIVRAWAAHFSFPRKILQVLCGYFKHQRRVLFE